jgi:hypothetical protein
MPALLTNPSTRPYAANVRATRRGQRPRHQPLDLRLVGHVSGHGQRRPATHPYFLSHSLHLGRRARSDGHARPLSRASQGDAPPDALAAAGDHDHLNL